MDVGRSAERAGQMRQRRVLDSNLPALIYKPLHPKPKTLKPKPYHPSTFSIHSTRNPKSHTFDWNLVSSLLKP